MIASPRKPEDYSALEENARVSCLNLSKIWHYVALVMAIILVLVGLIVAATASNFMFFLIYVVCAFFAFLICESVSAVIKLLACKR